MKGSKYHGGSTNHTEKGHFSKRGLNILWIKIDPLDFTIISPLKATNTEVKNQSVHTHCH
jgi:hypothetical protein